MKPLSDFLPRILPHVIGCPNTLAEQSLIDAAISFCDKSLAIRYVPDIAYTTASVARYDFDLPASQDFSRVVYLKVNGRELKSAPAWNQPLVETSDSLPTHYFVTQNESELQLNLYPTPDDVYTIEMSVALRPTRNASRLEDDLYTYWHEALVFGALSRIMNSSDQPYSDPVMARNYAYKAYTACQNARIEGNIGRTISSLSARPTPFVR